MATNHSPRVDQPLWLFNCKRCDDVQRVIERERQCECGLISAQLADDGIPVLKGATGAGRLMQIPWEDYDGAIPGVARVWQLAKAE